MLAIQHFGKHDKIVAESHPVQTWAPSVTIVASLLLVEMPFATSSLLFLVVRPGAPSSVLAPSSDARSP